MSWIDDAANNAKNDDDDRSRREQAYQQQLSGLWEALTAQIRQDIKQINENKDLVLRRLGGSPLKFVPDSDQAFIIEKQVFPAMYLRVTNHHRYITAEREVVTNGQSPKSKTSTDRLNIETDSNYDLFLSLAKADAKPVTVVEASQYLLEPFLTK